jgi:hypothetical protein
MATKLTPPVSPFKKGMDVKLYPQGLQDFCPGCGLPMSKKGICPNCGRENK